MEKSAREILAVRIAEILTASGLSTPVKAWKDRIYFNGFGRDIAAYLEIDKDLEAYANPQALADSELNISTIGQAVGLSLKVYSSCQQTRRWKLNRCKQVKHAIMLDLQKAGYCQEAPASWQDVIL